jgi:hypothetical protein
VAVTLAPGQVDPSVQVLGSRFEFHGLEGGLLMVNQLALAFTTLAVAVCAGSLVARFRHAHGVERQQLRWVAVAAALLVVAAGAALVGLALDATEVVTWAISAWVAGLPLPIGAAVLRYRLYDLDRIISRTLAYGLLTLLLGGATPWTRLVPSCWRWWTRRCSPPRHRCGCGPHAVSSAAGGHAARQ